MEAGWTIDTLKALLDERYIAELRFHTERDRRYMEVAAARAEALKIKEEADKTALGLQRDYQTYKDERDNRLREQISDERGLYVTKSELVAAVKEMQATIAPIATYVASQQGRSGGLNAGWGYLVGLIVVVNIIIGIVLALLR
jgi:vacuolar-type H+-ATPase subunit H